MRIVFEKNAKDFMKTCGDFLCHRASEHNLILSICQRVTEEDFQATLFGAVMDDDGNVILCAVQMPDRNIVLSHTADHEAVAVLADAWAEKIKTLPGIVGPSAVAGDFAALWEKTTGQQSIQYMDQIIYSLDQVTMPDPMPAGTMRPAQEKEKDLIAGWMRAFSIDVLPKAEELDMPESLEKASKMIAGRKMFVWDVKGKPMAMVALVGAGDEVRIGSVYTPEEGRGKGYASAVVATLSQAQLDQGMKKCCLYADAKNPVSNSIYRKIGYAFVGRSSMYVLE